jgi:hypothetical protein
MMMMIVKYTWMTATKESAERERKRDLTRKYNKTALIPPRANRINKRAHSLTESPIQYIEVLEWSQTSR